MTPLPFTAQTPAQNHACLSTPEASIQPHRWECVSERETTDLSQSRLTPLEPWLGNEAGAMQFTAWESELGIASQGLELERNPSGDKVQGDWG